jgi:hypothetical protein
MAVTLFGGPKELGNSGAGEGSAENFVDPGGGCDVSCPVQKGKVMVDIKNKCMCISGEECFKVDTGKPGTYTTNGLGNMGRANGDLYSTKAGPGDATKFDFDAVSMGIGSNTVYGKWIHKARDCQGGGESTIGCIGVPCAKWPKVKKLALAGNSLQVCGGVNYPTSIDKKFPQCRGGVPCYARISKSQSNAERVGLYQSRSNDDDSGSGRAGSGQR